MWDPDAWRDRVNEAGFECSFAYESDKRMMTTCRATIYRSDTWAEIVREGDDVYGYVMRRGSLTWRRVSEQAIREFFKDGLMPEFAEAGNGLPPQVTIEYEQPSIFE
jgi:hypothetical protein